MSIQTLSTLLAAILTFVIGWSVILRDRRHRQYVAFTIFCFNLCFWYLAHFFATTLQSSKIAWFAHFFALAIPLSAQRFFRAFLADDPHRPQPVARIVVGATVLFYLLLLAGLFHPIHTRLWFRLPMIVFVFASLYYCIYMIYLKQRAVSGRPEAMRWTSVLYGGAAAVTLAATDFVPRAGFAFPTIGNVLTVIYMYFISQTLFHYRLLDIKELLGKMVTLATLVLILTVIYGLLLAWVGPNQPGVFFFNTIVASFVILVLFDPLRTRVEDYVNRWLFAERYAFSRRLRMLTQELANIIEVPLVVDRLLQEMEGSARVTHCSIYLADPSEGDYRLAGFVGPQPVEVLDGLKRRLFFEHLRRGGGWLSAQALERELADQLAQNLEDAAVATRNVISTLDDQHADLCIALSADDQLLGLFNLRDERVREAYTSDELELLRRVAAQAAITLRNSQLYEALKERDRLAALGQMAAGLAHEIRNPLGAIKGAAQLLSAMEPWASARKSAEADNAVGGGPVESIEYLDIIGEEVERLDRVVSQFLGYARPDRGQRQQLNVNDIVYKTVQLLRSQKPAGVEIDVELDKELPPVRADGEQLRQVFLNFAINAFQAMEGGGRLRLRTRQRRGLKAGQVTDFVEIAFHDTGKGIAADALSDIFIPFFTTKDKGTGLGLPICQRIVENHSGTIEVRSEPGRGAVFSVVLPSADAADTTQKITRLRRTTLGATRQTVRVGAGAASATRGAPAGDSSA